MTTWTQVPAPARTDGYVEAGYVQPGYVVTSDDWFPYASVTKTWTPTPAAT